MLRWRADLNYDPTGRRAIEAESRVTTTRQNFRSGRLVSCILDSLIQSARFGFIVNKESDVKKRRICSVDGILAVHEDEDEAVRSLEDGESIVSTTFRNLEVQAALETIAERGNIADSQIDMIEFHHEIISITRIRVGYESSKENFRTPTSS